MKGVPHFQQKVSQPKQKGHSMGPSKGVGAKVCTYIVLIHRQTLYPSNSFIVTICFQKMPTVVLQKVCVF
jgi:hypothetical protein